MLLHFQTISITHFLDSVSSLREELNRVQLLVMRLLVTHYLSVCVCVMRFNVSVFVVVFVVDRRITLILLMLMLFCSVAKNNFELRGSSTCWKTIPGVKFFTVSFISPKEND